MKFTLACPEESGTHRCFVARAGRAAAVALYLALPAAGAQTIDAAFQPQPDDQVWTAVNHPAGDILAGGFFDTIDGLNVESFTRLANDGHVVPEFENTRVRGGTWAISASTDDRVVIGGDISMVEGLPRRGVARFNADGSLDTSFADPALNGGVKATAVQADGKVLVAGHVNGSGCIYLCRLNSDGSRDTTFAPQVNDWTETMALQPDGKILIGGHFTTINGTERKYLARLNPDGSLDGAFNPRPDFYVHAIALQPDGRILLGGAFSKIGAADYRSLARINADGSRDGSFGNPNITTGWVYTIAPQADGKLVVGGGFTSVNGVPRGYVARFNGDGSLDTGFGDLGASWTVYGLTLQPDGRLLMVGRFTDIGGMPIPYLARTLPLGPAQQSLNVGGGGTSVTWLRSGASPEVMAPPVAYRSTDGGATWSSLGGMQRISGGWKLTGLAPLIGQEFTIRVDGLVQGGNGSNSQGRVRMQEDYYFGDEIFSGDFDGMETLAPTQSR
ncbi:MAG: delta-60 repeat domain-containing protein [Xanthomonadales bacterium]|nr:delta-60 repeat domain-containing protein [Xanthomonadales bacterium]